MANTAGMTVRRTISNTYPYFGCDPELFVQDASGRIVGAERIINNRAKSILGGRAVLDGVQLELHPAPQMCRANLGNGIQYIFQALREHLARPEFREKGFKICFSPFVEISKKEHQALSEETRILGCNPSLNVYKESPLRVNPLTYRKRSAGGHIHIGSISFEPRMKTDPEIAKRLVRVLDIIVGNTCVMVDRDPFAALRRRNYGRAGEYRLPPHGLEYRVLSNFWMRSYQLFSMVTGLTRLGLSIMKTQLDPHTTQPNTFYNGWPAEEELLALVNRDDIVKAINTNDYDLARSNYEKIKPFIEANCTNTTESGLCAAYLANFDIFLDRIRDHGIEYWFPDDPMDHWCEKPEGHGTGWESFIGTKILAIEAQKARVAAAQIAPEVVPQAAA